MPSMHPREDRFEDYVFERLAEDEVEAFEEHLLVCERCQHTLAKTDDYIRLMKAATSFYAGDSGLQFPAAVPVRRDEGLRWNAAAAAVLLLTCLTALFSWRNPSGDSKTVELMAYRGGPATVQADAPAGRPLDLRIDLKDVPPAGGYRVEVVDERGQRVWFGGTPAHLSPGLSAGDYWVRLATDLGQPLREFGLHVE